MTIGIAPGETFAGYRIDALIGRGGMGVVYRATDPSLERPVALKLIAPEYAQDPVFRHRFLKEPRMAAALDHPNVVPIYEAREHAGQLYLAMRYVAGEDLRTRIARAGPLAPQETIGVLAQVADALDAAHRRGLVHRDVKPANVLLDEDGHAYLTDFGITKSVSSESTATEQVVGTLEYLAPERIRGEAVDGRVDEYALACVLAECLAGTPPFRRESEAETMWAHLQSDRPRLPGHPGLDPVLAKGLATEPQKRYATCTQLIEAAHAVLVPPPAAVRAPRLMPALRRHRRAILAAGVALVAAAVGAIVLSGEDSAPALAQVGNGVAAVSPANSEVTALVESATAPSNVAVGEGAVWVLNTQRSVVTRIDPKTKAVTATFETRGVPTDLAAGGGAVWVGNGGGGGANFTVSVSRIDPRTHEVTRTLKLPDKSGTGAQSHFNWGHAEIVVGAGAVWARNPDATISRIDPATGRLQAIVDVEADALAADRGNLWFLDGQDVVRIDPRRNKPGQRISVGSPSPSSIAVGGRMVWVVAEQEGLLWRVEPGPGPVTRSIDVGVGATYVAYGAGAVWTANFRDGRLTRVDPRTGAVEARTPIGAAQSLVAGAGSAWVSTAGRAAAGTLPADVCGEQVSGGREPDVLIVSDLPLQGGAGANARAMADAIRLVLAGHDYRAGRFTVGYRSCDDSTRQSGGFENRRCAANANAYAGARKLVALIGPYHSYCAQIEVPILNRAPGPLPMISPTNSYPGLTRDAGVPPPDGNRGEPDVYYPTGRRNYVRLQAGDDFHGIAFAALAKRLGHDGVYVVDDGSGFWKGLLSDPFRHAAKRLGVRVAGSAAYDPAARSQVALAERIASSGAEAVVLGGDPYYGADRVVKALRDRLGDRLTIMASYFFGSIPDVLERLGRDAHGIYVGTSDIPRGVLPLNAVGRSFARELSDDRYEYGVLEAGQATEIVLDAIARSDGTRASVLRELFRTKVEHGILGSFAFDGNGDMTVADAPILRITGSTPPAAHLPPGFQGAVVDRVMRVPRSLAE